MNTKAEYKKVEKNVDAMHILDYVEKVISFGRGWELRAYTQDQRKDLIHRVFMTRMCRELINNNKSEMPAFEASPTAFNESSFAIAANIGRNDYSKIRGTASISVTSVQEIMGRITVEVTLYKPCRVTQKGAEKDLEEWEYTPFVKDLVEQFCDWIFNSLSKMGDLCNGQDLSDNEHILALRTFYSTLEHFGLTSIPTESVVSMAKIYPNIVKTFPAFAAANDRKRCSLMTKALTNAGTCDIHLAAKKLFWVLYEAEMTNIVIAKLKHWGGNLEATLYKEYEHRADRVPYVLSDKELGTDDRAYYRIRNDLIWTLYSYKIGRSNRKSDVRICMMPFEIWHLLTDHVV